MHLHEYFDLDLRACRAKLLRKVVAFGRTCFSSCLSLTSSLHVDRKLLVEAAVEGIARVARFEKERLAAQNLQQGIDTSTT